MSGFNPMSPGDDLRTFTVQRLGDVSGTSGTGPVAKGVVFPDGTTVVQWQTRARSVVVYTSFVDALYIHGHGDKTGFVFDADPSTIHFPDGSTKGFGANEPVTSWTCACGKFWSDESEWLEHSAVFGCNRADF